MLVLINLGFLVAVAPYPSIPSLELEGFLHGGNPNEALIVSKLNSADEIDYKGALEDLKANHDYRFLMELGINRIEIGGSDTPFAVDTLEMPSEQVVQESVGKLRTALEIHGFSANDVIPLNLVQQVMDVPGHAKLKLHRIHQISFLVERFDAFKSRFASQDNVNGYVNHDQTRTKQLDTVFKILYGHERPDNIFLEDFNLAKINLDDWDVPDVSRKLTIPHQKVPEILSLAINNAAKSSSHEYLNKLRLLVRRQWNRYSLQVREYSEFVRWATPTPPALTQTNLFEDIRIVQRLRSRALAIYESFKLPFPNAANRVFSIYLHDPEERGLHFNSPNAVAFGDLYDATVFAQSMVIKSFEEVPEFYYSSLRDVVLFRSGPVSGRTLNDGRAIALFGNPSLYNMMHIVRHECGHVLHHKMGYREIKNKLLAISRANGGAHLSQQTHALLSRAHDLFYPSHPLNPVAYADYKDGIYLVDEKALIWTIDRIFDVNNGQITFSEADMLKLDALLLTPDKISTLHTVREDLVDDVRLQANIAEHFLPTLLSSSVDSMGFSSYYAMSHVDEEVAELLQQLGSDDMREGLRARTKFDTILRQKVAVLLESLAIGKPESVVLVDGWFESRNEIQKHAQPVVVVIVSENGVESVEVMKSAKAYVAQQIKSNRDVSFLSLKIVPHAENSLQVLQQCNTAYTERPEIRFFPESLKGRLPALEETLERLHVGTDGQRKCVRIVIK